jgi:outer membrane lipoprotein-sorting protein
MRLRLAFIFVFGSIFIFSSFQIQNSPSAVQIVKEMFARTKQIKTMSYTMKKKERINGHFQSQESDVKLNVNPLKMYLKQSMPKQGLEVLYVEGKNGNKALINTNGFPWMNISLEPMGNVMRDKQHHTVFQSGYAHLMAILEHLTSKYQPELETIMTRTSAENIENNECWLITFTNPHFKYYKYTVGQNETILTIADKSKLSEHMILERNPSISNYEDVKPGQIIELPNDYSNKLELYVDKVRMIPLIMKVYDDKGLYEYYEYSNVKLNPVLKEEDFDKDNSDYGF